MRIQIWDPESFGPWIRDPGYIPAPQTLTTTYGSYLFLFGQVVESI
jgi:hypothetical protein